MVLAGVSNTDLIYSCNEYIYIATATLAEGGEKLQLNAYDLASLKENEAMHLERLRHAAANTAQTHYDVYRGRTMIFDDANVFAPSDPQSIRSLAGCLMYNDDCRHIAMTMLREKCSPFAVGTAICGLSVFHDLVMKLELDTFPDPAAVGRAICDILKGEASKDALCGLGEILLLQCEKGHEACFDPMNPTGITTVYMQSASDGGGWVAPPGWECSKCKELKRPDCSKVSVTSYFCISQTIRNWARDDAFKQMMLNDIERADLPWARIDNDGHPVSSFRDSENAKSLNECLLRKGKRPLSNTDLFVGLNADGVALKDMMAANNLSGYMVLAKLLGHSSNIINSVYFKHMFLIGGGLEKVANLSSFLMMVVLEFSMLSTEGIKHIGNILSIFMSYYRYLCDFIFTYPKDIM